MHAEGFRNSVAGIIKQGVVSFTARCQTTHETTCLPYQTVNSIRTLDLVERTFVAFVGRSESQHSFGPFPDAASQEKKRCSFSLRSHMKTLRYCLFSEFALSEVSFATRHDGTFREFCRPSEDGYNGPAQRIQYSGHKKAHGTNF